MAVIDDPNNTAGIDSELGHSPTDQGVESGDGGDIMNVWASDRTTILRRLVAAGSVVNRASFEIPSGVVDSNSNTADIQFEDTESYHGLSVRGKYLEHDGQPMPGRASIRDGNDNIVSSDAKSGEFIFNGGAPQGVEEGANVGIGQFEFNFEPAIPAIPDKVTGIVGNTDLGTIRYGSVSGEVTDYNGRPVEGVNIITGEVGDATDPDGIYRVQGPGGRNVTLKSFGTGFEKDVTFVSADDATVDWQYSGFEMYVRLPDGTVVPGVDIELDITSQVKFTDAQGRARFDTVPPEEEITVSLFGGTIEQELSSGREGILAASSAQLGFGYKGDVNEVETRRDVLDIDISVIEGGDDKYTVVNQEEGRYVVGGLNPGQVEVRIGGEDKRYKRESIFDSMSQGEVKELNVFIERKKNLSTY